MKCGKCGGALGKTVEAHVTGVCPNCAGVLETDAWQSELILPYASIPDFTTTHETTESWWLHKTELVSWPKMPNTPAYMLPPGALDAIAPFEGFPPEDAALAAIGRAFDDAIDLAYLG